MASFNPNYLDFPIPDHYRYPIFFPIIGKKKYTAYQIDKDGKLVNNIPKDMNKNVLLIENDVNKNDVKRNK